MATVINNPSRTREDTGSGLGVILAVILVLALAVLLFVFGVPALRNTAPAVDNGSTINVPDTLDVNLNSGAGAVDGTMAE